ncbi:DNA repair protein RadA [bacterium]|nr:DNA repair protein RadA [bacterium]NIN93219.1 DNA repair protein RadA [bacterium]NIO19016.1 DNA repair protein RadA [bacterium]NIO74145.1 DNA repair protein RadA [bacterium]
MAKVKTAFICQECGYQSARWLGKCPTCGKWNSLVEERLDIDISLREERRLSTAKPSPISSIKSQPEERFLSGISEFDHVLGGGVVAGSLVLLAGSPGIGKSTLLLQVAGSLAASGKKCLYISGEESLEQIKLRAERLRVDSSELIIFSETNIREIINQIKQIEPKFVIIDSIQTVYHDDFSGSPGSVGQVKQCTEELLYLAKSRRIPVFISGQITKEGAIAGPKVLEHIVDTVLYFEGSRDHLYRILRVEKNRYGTTSEISIFEMKSDGLKQVLNPSQIFLEGRIATAGTVVVAPLEGTRPLLVELQALVTRANFNLPRRQASGLDYNRILLLVAVLEKNFNLHLESCDIFLNIAGGVKIYEPGCDLGVIAAIYSGAKNRPVGEKVVVIGEVGLAGEVRGVTFIEKRVSEAEKLGFKTCVLPSHNLKEFHEKRKIDLIGVSSVNEAIEKLRLGRA